MSDAMFSHTLPQVFLLKICYDLDTYSLQYRWNWEQTGQNRVLLLAQSVASREDAKDTPFSYWP